MNGKRVNNMDKCKKTVMYSYINSGNHGCEAIARSTYDILELEGNDNYIFTTDFLWDQRMNLDEKWKLKQIPCINGLKPIASIIPRIMRKAKIDTDALWKYQYKDLITVFDKDTLAISTGGDVYCYDESDWLTYLNRVATERGAKTVLWGCSIEYERLDKRVVNDLMKYNLITVRESYTKRNLQQKGIFDNVKYYPDPAFVLKKQPIDLWDWETMGEIVGINLSTYVVKTEKIYQIFCRFVKYILENTEYSVMLIPHVFWGQESDLKLLNRMYNDLPHSSKLFLVNQEYNCMQLKYIISKCSFYMGARTHSVIAAYSSYVPALAFSYSVKSKGIAFDLFGEENYYVLSVTEDITTEKLLEYLFFLVEHQDSILEKLKDKIPQYEDMVRAEKEAVELLFNK